MRNHVSLGAADAQVAILAIQAELVRRGKAAVIAVADDHGELVDRLERLLTDQTLRDELGVKARARSQDFSWPQSAAAMRTVLESVHAGGRVSGVVQP